MKNLPVASVPRALCPSRRENESPLRAASCRPTKKETDRFANNIPTGSIPLFCQGCEPYSNSTVANDQRAVPREPISANHAGMASYVESEADQETAIRQMEPAGHGLRANQSSVCLTPIPFMFS